MLFKHVDSTSWVQFLDFSENIQYFDLPDITWACGLCVSPIFFFQLHESEGTQIAITHYQTPGKNFLCFLSKPFLHARKCTAIFSARKKCKLFMVSYSFQIVIWWAGLMRGAVSIALAFKQVSVFPFSKVLDSQRQYGNAVFEHTKILHHQRNVIQCLVSLFAMQFTHAGVTLDPINATMVTTTIVVVLFSTIVSNFFCVVSINGDLEDNFF